MPERSSCPIDDALGMAQAERERECTYTKQQRGKVWATKAQQDLPINAAINSQLLACKAYEVSSISKQKLALWVSPYFHILALDYVN
jgi:hypothetical protein